MNPDPAFWPGRRVLVTGHTGFKGAWLTLWLRRLGAEITGLALPPEAEPSLFRLVAEDACRSIFADIRDLAEVRHGLDEARPSVILHLAAQSLVRPSYRDPVGTYATNVMGTVNILEAAREREGIDAVVVVTSDKCYENRDGHRPYREDDALGGHDPYSSSKACAELVAGAYRLSFFGDDARCGVATARAGNVIGGGDWSEDRLVPDVIRAFAAGAAVAIRNPGAIRPWQHVLEPLAGYLLLAERLASADRNRFSQAWNFGPIEEDCRPVADIVEHLASMWGPSASWKRAGGEHPPEAGLLKVDSSKARARLGWRPRLRLEEALDWTTTWYRDQADGADPRALTLAQIARYEALAAAA